jgi:hypothetical protein
MKQNYAIQFVLLFAVVFAANTNITGQNWDMKGNGNAPPDSKLGTTNPMPLRIITNNLERVNIDVNGNVGVGTTAPSSRLHVIGNGFFGAGLKVTDNGTFFEKGEKFSETASLLVRGSKSAAIIAEGINYGVLANGNERGVVAHGVSAGVVGIATNHYGVRGQGPTGVYGEGPTQGVWGKSPQIGVHGDGTGVGWGGYFYSEKGSGIYAATGNADKNYAAVFNGNILVNNVLNPSDERLKKNIEPVYNALDLVKMLQPKRFEFRVNENDSSSFYMPDGKHYGFIAQEVEEFLPSLVMENDISSYGMMQIKSAEQTSYKSVNYIEFIPILTKALQEQQVVIENQQRKINELTTLVSDILKKF